MAIRPSTCSANREAEPCAKRCFSCWRPRWWPPVVPEGTRLAPAPSAPAAVARVLLSPDSTTVAPGKTVQLTARVEDASGNPVSDRNLDWISYDASVATVNGGVVTGVGAGTATITATTDGKRGSARVTVVAPPTVLAIACGFAQPARGRAVRHDHRNRLRLGAVEPAGHGRWRDRDGERNHGDFNSDRRPTVRLQARSYGRRAGSATRVEQQRFQGEPPAHAAPQSARRPTAHHRRPGEILPSVRGDWCVRGVPHRRAVHARGREEPHARDALGDGGDAGRQSRDFGDAAAPAGVTFDQRPLRPRGSRQRRDAGWNTPGPRRRCGCSMRSSCERSGPPSPKAQTRWAVPPQ